MLKSCITTNERLLRLSKDNIDAKKKTIEKRYFSSGFEHISHDKNGRPFYESLYREPIRQSAQADTRLDLIT